MCSVKLEIFLFDGLYVLNVCSILYVFIVLCGVISDDETMTIKFEFNKNNFIVRSLLTMCDFIILLWFWTCIVFHRVHMCDCHIYYDLKHFLTCLLY